jgi:hypothetical protein
MTNGCFYITKCWKADVMVFLSHTITLIMLFLFKKCVLLHSIFKILFMMTFTKFFFNTLLFFVILSSCQKNAGPGGNSTIKGKVTEKNYNAAGTTLLSTYPAADKTVYIIYGDQTNVPSEKVTTGVDGSFEFNFLATGKYKIVIYSKCFDPIACPSGEEGLTVETAITKKKSIVELADIIIKN